MRDSVRKIAGLLASLTLVCSAGACSGADAGSGADPLVGGPTISIAVARDEPGFSRIHEGEYDGFDIDVARYVAQKLGYANRQIIFTSVDMANRVSTLAQAKADMLISELPQENVVPRSGNDVAKFAGSMFTSKQGFLVDSAARQALGGEHGLDGKRICVVLGGGVETAVSQAVNSPVMQRRQGYGQCLTALLSGDADAVAGDGAVLQGLASSSNGHASMLKETAGTSVRGIWTPSGTDQLSDKVNSILNDMVKDGSWKRAVDRLEQQIGYRAQTQLNPPVVPMKASGVVSLSS